jgi:hypothetical protein
MPANNRWDLIRRLRVNLVQDSFSAGTFPLQMFVCTGILTNVVRLSVMVNEMIDNEKALSHQGLLYRVKNS